MGLQLSSYLVIHNPTLTCVWPHAEDQASNLLWRMQNGQVFTKHPPKVAIVLIGTNDLGAGGSCGRGEAGATAAANGTAFRSGHNNIT